MVFYDLSTNQSNDTHDCLDWFITMLLLFFLHISIFSYSQTNPDRWLIRHYKARHNCMTWEEVHAAISPQGGGGWELGGSHLQQPFTGEGGELSDGEGEDAESIFSHMDMLSPSHHTDAQTLALMLQEQLDAINNEIRYVCQRCFMV